MTTAGGLLLVLMLVLPLLGVLAALASGGRNARRVVLVALSLGFALAIALGIELVQSGQTLVYVLGGWAPPLGIALRADGLSVVMMFTTVLIVLAVAVYGQADFQTPAGVEETRAPFMFWRIRMLMRLGLQVANGQIPSLSHTGDHPHLAPVVEIPRSHKKPDPSPASTTTPAPVQAQPPVPASPTVAAEPATKQPVVESIDALAGMGFDPTNFQFGVAAR